ncbi:serine hydrolase domain-containing protein [Clostridium sp. ZS2-4]|uniref:serine hydrolase domain-containing protein n=1 Tax=Clostridium sp. ZS2-4 TaxID=2987703 RepID=UPI00227BC049|nr:serine hydrolase domain-containing protein [Clostridium sp. ZS2-4]MCY6354169.1 serine hydrolase [Clostridium sp. ZS2-4]
MKHINKFLFFLISVFVFINFLKSCTVSAKEVNSSELKVFLKKTIKENFEKYKLPSLSIVVVKDGQVIYENALGYADIENKIKADAHITVYRIGSISKLFTETAIMHLYEQGKIDLKEDANKYLKDIKIQNKFIKKVTVENLLTHTSGIDEATTPYGAAKTDKDMINLSQFLKKHPPVVVTEPGKICLYSNIGIDLLGNIIENVSGIKYEEYIQKNIFNVLDMKNSKVALPINNMAKNYDSLASSEYYYYNDNPAGGINSTPADMGKFMIAHLQNGVYKNQKMLKEETAKLMHEHHFANNNNLIGIGYGFWEKNFNGRRIIGHEGAFAIGYFGDMLLYPEENLGMYIVSNNLTVAAHAILNIENSFFNKFYPDNTTKAYSNSTMNSDDAAKYIGTYRSYHDSAKSNFSKFMSFLGAIDENEDVQIDYDRNKSTLIYHGISHLKQKEDVALIKTSNNLFRRADNNDLVAFREEKGKVKYVFLNNAPYDSFERVEFKDNYKLNLAVFIIVAVFFIFQVLKNLFLLLKNLCKRKVFYNHQEIEFFTIGSSKTFKLMIFTISLINIIALAGVLYWIISFDMYYSVTWYMKVSSILLIVSTILAVGSGIIFVLSIKKEKNKLSYKIFGSFSLLNIYAFVLFLYNLNLLGFKY